jgi:hypothetical protein
MKLAQAHALENSGSSEAVFSSIVCKSEEKHEK